MPRPNGYYWAREHRAQVMMIVLFKDGEWTFEGEDWSSDESQLIDIEGPLIAPPIQDAAKWRAVYDEEVAYRLREGLAGEIEGGWDYLFGYYWVRTTSASEPNLFWYQEGWGPIVGDSEFDEDSLEILSGPLTPPEVTITYDDLQ